MMKRICFFIISISLLVLLVISCDLFLEKNSQEFSTWTPSTYLNYQDSMTQNSPRDLTFAPDGRHLYMTYGAGAPSGVKYFERRYEGSLDSYMSNELDFFNGSIVQVEVSPDGKDVYVHNNTDIMWASRNIASGSLSRSSGIDVVSPAGGVQYIDLSPGGHNLYYVNGATGVYERDAKTGNLTLLETKGWGMNCVAIPPDGRHVYVGNGVNINWFERDVKTGKLSGEISDGINISTNWAYRFAISPDGRFIYVVDDGVSPVFIYSAKRDIGTGKLSDVKRQFLCTEDIESIAFSPDGRNIYAASSIMNRMDIFVRDITTGNITKSGYFDMNPESNGISGVVVSLDGESVYATALTGQSAGGDILTFGRDTGSDSGPSY